MTSFHIVAWVEALYTPERAGDVAETVHQFLIDSGQVSEVDTWVLAPEADDGSPADCPWCGLRRDPHD